MMNNSIQSYRNARIITTNSERLVLMCYNGAIDQLKIAIQKYRDKAFEEKSKAIKKTEDIINELRCSLDFEKGGSIARNLESLYNYMTRKLILVDVNKEINGLNEIISMLEELKSAWEIVLKAQSQNTPSNVLNTDTQDQAQRLSTLVRKYV